MEGADHRLSDIPGKKNSIDSTGNEKKMSTTTTSGKGFFSCSEWGGKVNRVTIASTMF